MFFVNINFGAKNVNFVQKKMEILGENDNGFRSILVVNSEKK